MESDTGEGGGEGEEREKTGGEERGGEGEREEDIQY